MTTGTYHGTWDQYEGQAQTWADVETDEVTWDQLGTVTAGTMSGSSPSLSWDVGDVATFAVTVRSSAGVPADATAVACTLTLPDGTSIAVRPVRTSAGVYEAGWTLTQSGLHVVSWVATGANASSYLDTFTAWDTSIIPVISLSQAKAHLNITSTEHDDELRRFCWVVTREGESYTGRVFGRRTVTDTLDGGWPEIVLTTRPVVSVASVTVNGEALDPTGYRLNPDAGVLTRISGYTRAAWTSGYANITVTYLAGYVLQPPTDTQGALELLRHLWRTQRGSLRPRTDDDPMAGMGFSIPNRVAELWDANMIPAV